MKDKHCLMLGENSDIGKGLKPLLQEDGYWVSGWSRGRQNVYSQLYPWNLVICMIGQIGPVGLWSRQDNEEWDSAIVSNVLLPVRLLRRVWNDRAEGASVCFFAGANPNRSPANYSAYYTGKMALNKAVEMMDAESREKMFTLGPGTVPTKIHKATDESGVLNEGLIKARASGGVKIQKIYDCLKWCVEQPKEVVGGRNICVSDPWGPELSERLKNNPALFKLRRNES